MLSECYLKHKIFMISTFKVMYIILLHNFNFEVCIIVEETNYTPFWGRGCGVVRVFRCG
jgi:hypothetical protein